MLDRGYANFREHLTGEVRRIYLLGRPAEVPQYIGHDRDEDQEDPTDPDR
jgi:hypothetical protein